MIPYGHQSISDEDIAAVVDVLRSDFLTQGPKVPHFEHAIASAVTDLNAPEQDKVQAVAVNSATSALHLACMALGVSQKSLVWTSPVTFVASANCARYCGADVDFVDIDSQTYNMSVEALRIKLEKAATIDKLPDVVIPVHLAGQSCDMRAIHELSMMYGFRIIEDASHAIGADYDNQPVGNCRFSDITVFSFHPVKIITTAEGGVAVTGNSELAERMASLRSHGITRDAGKMTNTPDGDWYYQQLELGFNYRLTELQAALGISQIQRLSIFVEERRTRAKRYNELLKDLPITLPYQHPTTRSSWHLYIIRPDFSQISVSHAEMFSELRAEGIGVNLHYIPLHLQPYYRDLGFHPGDFPEAERYYSEAISIPLFHGMTEEQQNSVVSKIRQVCR